MVKTICKYLFCGISWGCAFFVFVNLIGTAIAGDSFLIPVRTDFVRQALGAIIVGIFSGSTSIIYLYKKMPLWLQVVIHACIGLSSYFIVACHLGWMPSDSLRSVILFIICGILIFSGIWLGFYMYNKQETKKVNRRLQEIKQKRNEPYQ